MRRIIIVDVTLMNTEMTIVKDGILDIAIETMKADIRTIVASPLVEVEEVVIKVNTGLTTVLLIIVHMGYELFGNILKFLFPLWNKETSVCV